MLTLISIAFTYRSVWAHRFAYCFRIAANLFKCSSSWPNVYRNKQTNKEKHYRRLVNVLFCLCLRNCQTIAVKQKVVSITAFQIYLARYKHPRSFPSYQTRRHDWNQINSTKLLYALKYYLERSSSKSAISTYSNNSRIQIKNNIFSDKCKCNHRK